MCFWYGKPAADGRMQYMKQEATLFLHENTGRAAGRQFKTSKAGQALGCLPLPDRLHVQDHCMLRCCDTHMRHTVSYCASCQIQMLLRSSLCSCRNAKALSARTLNLCSVALHLSMQSCSEAAPHGRQRVAGAFGIHARNKQPSRCSRMHTAPSAFRIKAPPL